MQTVGYVWAPGSLCVCGYLEECFGTKNQPAAAAAAAVHDCLGLLYTLGQPRLHLGVCPPDWWIQCYLGGWQPVPHSSNAVDVFARLLGLLAH